MTDQLQQERARRLRTLHDGSRVLVLPNAWDAASARLFADIGFDAVATTSGGVAWSLGYGDGEQAPLAEIIAAVARMARVTPVPLTVDFEAGFGDSPAAITASVLQLIGAGAAGLNLEDGIRHEVLRPIDAAAERIAAARHAADGSGIPLVINARIDAWMVDRDAGRDELIAQTLERGRAYLAAGADCIFPIGLTDSAAIATVCRELGAPVNIAALPGLPDVAELHRLGVARLSTATRLASLAFAAARDAAHRLHYSGRIDSLDDGRDPALMYPEMQRLLAQPRA